MTINMIHLGVGVRGRHWLDIVAQHPDFASAACVDTSEAALQEVRTLARAGARKILHPTLRTPYRRCRLTRF